MIERHSKGIFPKGWRRGLPQGLDINTARIMTEVKDANDRNLVYKATGKEKGKSKEYFIGVKRTPMFIPGAIDGVNTIYLGPEVDEATARYS